MQPERALKLMLNWLTINVKASHTIQLRVEVAEEQTICTCWLKVNSSNVYVPHVYATLRVMGKVLHKSDSHVTYDTLTLEEITNSIKHANEVNGVQAYETKATMGENIEDTMASKITSCRYWGKINKQKT